MKNSSLENGGVKMDIHFYLKFSIKIHKKKNPKERENLPNTGKISPLRASEDARREEKKFKC